LPKRGEPQVSFAVVNAACILTAANSQVKLCWSSGYVTMPPFATLPKRLLLIVAILFGAATTGYSLIWMIHIRHVPSLGSYVRWLPNHLAEVQGVEDQSAAWRSGLRSRDRIVAVNDEKLDTPSPFYGYSFYRWIILGRTGDVVQLSIERPDDRRELTVKAVLVSYTRPPGIRGLASRAMDFYPVLLLIGGMLVLALRLQDRNAWLLALLFSGFICGAPLFEGSISPHLRGPVACYKATYGSLAAGVFCYFFLIFPVPSPIDRRLPRLKAILLFISACYSICLGLACLVAGGLYPAYLVLGWVSRKPLAWPITFYEIGLYSLGFVSLIWNSLRPATAEARRKTRVILWGMVGGFGPLFLVFSLSSLANRSISEIPFWMLSLGVISLSLMPLSFAYAVVKHRVLEIPVLLRRSARYLLVQRAYFVLLLLTAAVAIVVFTHTISRFFPAATNIGMPLSAVFGAVLVWASAPIVKRGTERIDRGFFRSAYDTRVILEGLTEKIRGMTERHQLARLLELEIAGALHPKSLACYLDSGGGDLVTESASEKPERGINPSPLPRPNFPFRFGATFVPKDVDAIPASMPLLAEIAHRGKAWDVPQQPEPEPAGDRSPLAPECLVPILGRENTLIGMLVLGPRLSEEPYSGEDKRLLDSVAAQAGIALENIRLAEEMAERLEAERRIAQEMEFAKQVQARLFPRKLPAMKCLEYTGICLQARQVGGDYYDFLELRPGRLALILADIAGKGMPGALLMANLQANLRGQYAMALDNLPRLLASVNRLFYESTDNASYATVFFADYDDHSRKLRYANCGHLPALLLRASENAGSPLAELPRVEWLHSTSTVMGMFEDWRAEIAEVELSPGDTLLLYTDGVTEASNANGEEFGQYRLLETVTKHSNLPVGLLLQALVEEIQQFSAGREQQDDITAVIARFLQSFD